MKILITGAKGFIGKNLIAQLHNIQSGKATNNKLTPTGELTIFEYDMDSDPAELDIYCKNADFVFNLAGVNRPKNQDEFMEGNFGFTLTLLNTLKKYNNTCPIMISSSIQATLNNPYGESKRAGEDLMKSYSKETGAKILIYRFPNVFGKWCRPNYNSVIATFCDNIAHDKPIQINDPNTIMHLVYIDDVVDEMIAALQGNEHKNGQFCEIPIVYTITLGDIAKLLYSFKEYRETLNIPDVGNELTKKLYATYLSYLPIEKFSYPLKMNRDERGNFTEIIRTTNNGQFSVNISKPGITKGNHWHHTKVEKFVVVHGHALIQQRNLHSNEVINIEVSGEHITVVETIPGYTHNLINLSETEDLITFIWCNECFNPNHPDTFYEKV